MKAQIREEILASIRVKEKMMESQSDVIAEISQVIIDALLKGKKILFCGNGGSAADAQHLAAELVSKFKMERRGLPSLALNANTSILTAIGNDYSFERVFARQVEALGGSGDVLVGISTSGNSGNVVAAMEVAKEKDMINIALTGETGGKMKFVADYILAVPSNDTPRIQECHITAGHIICGIVEAAVCSEENE
jgi:D-sedoheptulose 7-phosphate isomerase